MIFGDDEYIWKTRPRPNDILSEQSIYSEEVKRAFKYLYMGCNTMYLMYAAKPKTTNETLFEMAKGLENIQHGSVILHYLAIDLEKGDSANLFPLNTSSVLELLKTNTIDDLAEKFKIIKYYAKEFLGKNINFHDEVFLDEHKRILPKILNM